MKAKNFQDDIPSIPIDTFEHFFIRGFDLIKCKMLLKNCHYIQLVGEPLRLELNFTSPLEHVTDLIVLRERMSSVAGDKFGVDGKSS